MIDDVTLADEPVHHRLVHDGLDGELEVWHRPEVSEVLHSARGQVIDDGDLVTRVIRGRQRRLHIR